MKQQRLGIPPRNRTAPVEDDIRKLKELPERKKNSPLSLLEKVVILGGMADGLPISRIAEAYNIPSWSIQRFRWKLYDYPLAVFRLHVIS